MTSRNIRICLKALCLVVALTFVLVGTAEAQQYGQTAASGLTDSEIDKRLSFLEQRLDDSKTHGQVWWYGWLTVNSVSFAGLTATAATVSNHDDRIKNATNATKAAIGLGRMLLDPLEARKGADPIRELPSATREDRLKKLRAAEEQLRQNAKRAESRWSWKRHLGNAVINGVAGGFVAWQGETGHAYEVGVGGFIGGLAFILTQPWAPEDDWQDYQRLTTSNQQTLDWGVSVATLPEGGAMLNMKLEW